MGETTRYLNEILTELQPERPPKPKIPWKTWLVMIFLVLVIVGINIAILQAVQKSRTRAEATVLRIAEIESTLDKHANELSELSGTLASLTYQVNQIVADVQKISKQAAGYENALTAYDEKIGSLQKANADYAATFENLINADNSLSSKIDDLVNQLTMLKRRKEVVVDSSDPPAWRSGLR